MSDAVKVDESFRAHLRQEMLKQQDRRADHVKSKFAFVIALGGLSGTLISLNRPSLAINGLVYAIPLVAALFDFYILGGEFAVKRIRSFLIAQDDDRRAERLWLEHLDSWPKGFMQNNRKLTTGFIDVACVGVALGNLVWSRPPAYHWAIFFAWLVAVGALFRNLASIESKVLQSVSDIARATSPLVVNGAGREQREERGAAHAPGVPLPDAAQRRSG